jgi:selenocysteine-specific translation elongation factor
VRITIGRNGMGNITVAILGAQNYGNTIAKKGTSTDITLYNLKKGEDTVTLIEPTRYPERLAPLFYACALAKEAIVVVDELNATFGEQLVMLQCSNIKSGYIVLRNYIPKEKIQPIIKDTILEKFEFVADDPNQLRDKLLADASKQKPTPPQQEVGTVPVDHAFNVKGVGVVVLGIVFSGIIRKHAVLNVIPSNKSAQIRSIQKHDDEFDVAGDGDRVGLALKNVEVGDLDRGTILTNDPSIKIATKLQVKASLVKYWQTPIKPGMVVHIGYWTQFIAAKVETVSDTSDPKKPDLSIVLDKPLAFQSNSCAVLMYLDGTKLRVAGTITLS